LVSWASAEEVLIRQMQKLMWQGQWRQDIDFIDPRVAQLRWLATKRKYSASP